jgi:hypothetical protein
MPHPVNVNCIHQINATSNAGGIETLRQHVVRIRVMKYLNLLHILRYASPSAHAVYTCAATRARCCLSLCWLEYALSQCVHGYVTCFCRCLSSASCVANVNVQPARSSRDVNYNQMSPATAKTFNYLP